MPEIGTVKKVWIDPLAGFTQPIRPVSRSPKKTRPSGATASAFGKASAVLFSLVACSVAAPAGAVWLVAQRSVGRLERFKGHHRILRALPAILAQAPDAVYLDSTALSIAEVEEAILKIVRSRVTNGRDFS